MQLSRERFSKQENVWIKNVVDVPTNATRYTYESSDAIYDVYVLANGDVFTQTNMQGFHLYHAVRYKIHEKIVEYFNIFELNEA